MIQSIKILNLIILQFSYKLNNILFYFFKAKIFVFKTCIGVDYLLVSH